MNSNNQDYIDIFESNPPKYNPIKKCHVLNFHGRVLSPSIKNFQISENSQSKFL